MAWVVNFAQVLPSKVSRVGFSIFVPISSAKLDFNFILRHIHGEYQPSLKNNDWLKDYF